MPTHLRGRRHRRRCGVRGSRPSVRAGCDRTSARTTRAGPARCEHAQSGLGTLSSAPPARTGSGGAARVKWSGYAHLASAHAHASALWRAAHAWAGAVGGRCTSAGARRAVGLHGGGGRAPAVDGEHQTADRRRATTSGEGRATPVEEGRHRWRKGDNGAQEGARSSSDQEPMSAIARPARSTRAPSRLEPSAGAA